MVYFQCLEQSNVDTRIHFERRQEADSSGPRGEHSWKLQQMNLALPAEEIDKLASRCSGRNHTGGSLPHQWLLGSLLLVITSQEFANKVSSGTFILSHLAGFLLLMHPKLMGPLSLILPWIPDKISTFWEVWPAVSYHWWHIALGWTRAAISTIMAPLSMTWGYIEISSMHVHPLPRRSA